MLGKKFCDKQMLMDILSSQKFITEGYNSFANECSTPSVKSDFMNFLHEKRQIQNDVFTEMNIHG